MNDTLLVDAVSTTIEVGQAIKNGDIINGVPNSLLSFIITTIGGFVIRAIEKRRLRKKGLLVNKANENGL
jgi:accessory colonization factor AcfC